MRTAQLLKLLHNNRELIQRNNARANDDLQELNKECVIVNEEIFLNLQLNNSLAEWHFNSNYHKAIENSLRVMEQCKKTSQHNLLARHGWVIGYCYAALGEFKPAEKFLLSALNILVKDEREFIPLKTDILLALTMNEQLGDRGAEKSIRYLTEAIALLADKKYAIRKATCLIAMGNVNINEGKTEEALKSYLAAADTYERKYDLANMASAYSNIGTCYIEMKDFDRAEKILEKSLELRLKVGSPEHLSISYYNLALVYKEKNNLDRARELLLKSKDILMRINNKHLLADTESFLTDIALLKSKEAVIV